MLRGFGAARGVQWPRLAIRRFLLYDVLLHEIGHLQIVASEARRRQYFNEKLAEEFADDWRRRLWSRHYYSDDPAHNGPYDAELAVAPEPAHQRLGLRPG
jgi:hypothetical protein